MRILAPALGAIIGLTACQPQTIVQTIQAPSDEFGRVYVPLTVESSSGQLYMLEFDSIEIIGESESNTITLDGSGELDISLTAGTYDLVINDYAVYRDEAGEWMQVDADLLSDNPQRFTIEAYSTTYVSLDFAIWSEDASEDIAFEGGDLEIEINIYDEEPECEDEIIYTFEEDVTVESIEDEELICEESCLDNGLLFTGQSFSDTMLVSTNLSCRCITDCAAEETTEHTLSSTMYAD